MATTWYAQNGASAVNISAWSGSNSTVWNSAANGSGSYMAGASFAAYIAANTGDSFVANNQAGNITIDTDFTCATLTTGSTLGGTAGGHFVVGATRSLTMAVLAGSTPCITMNTGSYTLTILGPVTGGTASGAYGVSNGFNATLVINNGVATAVTGGSNANAYGIALFAATNTAITTITGNIIATSAYGVYNVNGSAGNLLTINGNVTGATAFGVLNNAGCTCVVNGNVTGGSSTLIYGISNSGTVTINGNVTGGTGQFSYAVYNGSATAMNIASGNIINNTHTNALAGPWNYNPGAGNYIEYPKTPSGVNDYGAGTAARPVSGQMFPRGV
jgi:hypothetical protein